MKLYCGKNYLHFTLISAALLFLFYVPPVNIRIFVKCFLLKCWPPSFPLPRSLLDVDSLLLPAVPVIKILLLGHGRRPAPGQQLLGPLLDGGEAGDQGGDVVRGRGLRGDGEHLLLRTARLGPPPALGQAAGYKYVKLLELQRTAK